MTEAEALQELERCKDVGYALRTYCTIMDVDGKRKPTEQEITAFLLAKDLPQLNPKRGRQTFSPELTLHHLFGWMKERHLPVPISHYRP
jgi:hypothetical protein